MSSIELPHPHLRQIKQRLLTMLRLVPNVLCRAGLAGHAITQRVDTAELGVESETISCYLTHDGKTGICPYWFTLYVYDHVAPQHIELRHLEKVRERTVTQAVDALGEFTALHGEAHYRDPQGHISRPVARSLALLRTTLRSLDDLCIAQIHRINPDTQEFDTRFLTIDLFLKDDPRTLSQLYNYKIKLFIAAPAFINDALATR